jgi:hypothetical protein
MKNPWTKKNPLMSMWMSSANAVIGAVRSRATAESKRQAATVMTKAAKQAANLWTGALKTPARLKKKRR